MAELIPPTLAELGFVFWGASWAEPLAETMQVTKEDVIAMDANPETIPHLMEEHLRILGEARVKEIQVMLEQLKATGLRR